MLSYAQPTLMENPMTDPNHQAPFLTPLQGLFAFALFLGFGAVFIVAPLWFGLLETAEGHLLGLALVLPPAAVIIVERLNRGSALLSVECATWIARRLV